MWKWIAGLAALASVGLFLRTTILSSRIEQLSQELAEQKRALAALVGAFGSRHLAPWDESPSETPAPAPAVAAPVPPTPQLAPAPTMLSTERLAARESDDRPRAREVVREEQPLGLESREEVRVDGTRAAINERLQRLAAKVSLSPAQRDGLFARLNAEHEEIAQLLRDARMNGGFHTVRDKMREVRASTDEEVRAFLGDDRTFRAYQSDRGE